MCGIFGYVGRKPALPFLVEGLKRLEYRGYDSAGFCVLNKNNFQVYKAKGKISELNSKELKNLQGEIGISHTRWATHGEPSVKNAHPHFDCRKEIAVVHNGIIENYQALKTVLKKEGHQFCSETDTEVIAHLIEKFSNQELRFENAVMKALKLLEGAFGLAILCQKTNKIIAALKGSPLVLGIGQGEMFVSSDATALLPYTKKVVYLDDNEMVVLERDNFSVKNFDGERKKRKDVQELRQGIAALEKGGFKHFMLKEIFEQPQAIENTLRGRISQGKVKLSSVIEPKKVKRIIITACGTSYYAGLAGKYIIEKLSGIPVEVDYASELRYRTQLFNEDDLLVVISQSGETADTLAALRLAKEKQVATLGIVNVVGSTIAREVGSCIFLHAGPEIGVASTKAFTCQLVALILLALFLGQAKGTAPERSVLGELSQVPKKIVRILKEADKIEKIAQRFKQSRNFLYLGRGFNFPVALEGALKLKEISYIHAEGYPAAEMKHGPIALIDENMPIVFIATKDKTYEKILSNMQEAKARRGKIIALVNEADKDISELADWVIKVPQTIELLSPIINVVPLQLLAYYIADAKGIDVDKPRNLAKSVTVE